VVIVDHDYGIQPSMYAREACIAAPWVRESILRPETILPEAAGQCTFDVCIVMSSGFRSGQ